MKVIAQILILVAALVTQISHAAGDAERGAAIGYSCLGCHGIEGYNNAYPSYHVPRLAGQKPAYIETALRAYREGLRKHPTMRAQAGVLTDADIANVVQWLQGFGSLRKTPDAQPATGPDTVQTCNGCHGAAGVSIKPPEPILSGQHQDYLRSALRQYRDGSRSGTVMTAFAATLSIDDVEAVTLYYANQHGLFTPATKK